MVTFRIEALKKALADLDIEFLMTVLDTMPIEFTIIDDNDNVRFWNKHGIRVFKRGPAVIGRNVRMCHPQNTLDYVEKVLKYLKSGEHKHLDFWIDKQVGNETRKLFIRYSAIRDDDGNYLGTLETTIDITQFQGITGERRVSDID